MPQIRTIAALTPPPTSPILAHGEKGRSPAIRDRQSPPGPLTAAEEFRARFVEEIARLDAERWVVVCRRFVANEAALAANRKRIATILSTYISAQLGTVKGFQEHTIAFNRWADARLHAVIQAVPETVEVEGQAFPLRSAAATAARAADSTLRLFEEGITDKRARTSAVPALQPFEGYVTLPDLPMDKAAAMAPSSAPRRVKPAAAGFSPAMFHIRFPEGYFTYDEPLPEGVKVAPWSWNRRATHHETWSLPDRADLACRFGGADEGICAVCGGQLQHLITLPALAGSTLEKVEHLTIVTCLSCLGWSEPVLHFQHDATGASQPTGVAGPQRAPELLAHAIRPATVHLSETPARWQRQRWGEADDQNLNRVGGQPTWIQTPEVLKCCRCRQRMSFLMQLDSELPTVDGPRWRWGSGGVLFVFWCGSCRVDSQVWQCT